MAQQKSKELATVNVSDTLKTWAPALKGFALKEFDQQNFFRSAILAITESDTLMECMATDQGRESLYNAMKRAFSTGLSLNPQEGKAAIIAYKGKASYQIMKEGAIDIVMDSGDVKKLTVEMVCEKDQFTIQKSPDGDTYSFCPARKDRGTVDGFFCWILDRDDVQHVKYMTEAECFEIRDISSTAWIYLGKKSNWAKFPKGMCKKTVIKAAIRDLYISPKAKSLFSAEESWPDEEDKPAPKDITPKPTGKSADDVTASVKKAGDPETKTESKTEGHNVPM